MGKSKEMDTNKLEYKKQRKRADCFVEIGPTTISMGYGQSLKTTNESLEVIKS